MLATDPPPRGTAEDPVLEIKDVSLDLATATDTVLLSNLLELYIHDLSAIFPSVELGADGRFGYPNLPLYWSESDRRFAFLQRTRGRLCPGYSRFSGKRRSGYL